MSFESINPATGEVLARFDEMSPEQVDQVLAQARRAFLQWRECTYDERAEPMRHLGQYLRQNRERLSRVMTTEMGKPIAETQSEVDKCAWACEFYAEHAEAYLAPERIATNATESYIAYEPLGVVLAVMPWNYPFWQVLRFAAPALMAGNAAVVKHAPNVPQSAIEIERMFRESGFPEGLVRNLFISPEETDKLIADDRIAAVTLTGSTGAGSAVAEAAGRAVKKCVLELGGSDPFIVLEDADLAGAVEFAIRSRFQNTGQSCIAAKRFLIVDAIADEFQERFVEAVQGLPMGDPLQPDTKIGPLARRDLRDNLVRQVDESLRMGARALCGGRAADRPGFFYEPTVLADVTTDMPVFREETFGPVAPIFRVRDEEEALAYANDSHYGLGSDLWTEDIKRAKRIAGRIESGGVFVNGMVASDPRLPFGGVKRSGFGRELSQYGIREFTNVQTVWIGPAQGPQLPAAAAE
jgi:succinate-semialdehyde dehydrogenase/glutarate-semialdehyde dehydrogenase